MPRPGPIDREKSNSKLGAASLSVASQSPRFQASIAARTISTFSCDTAYSDSPAASRAAARSSPKYVHSTGLPSRNVHTFQT